MDNLNIIFVLGPPAAGKGTLCKLLVQEKGYVQISAGDYLRQLRESNPADVPAAALAGMTVQEIRSKIEARELIDPDNMAEILRYKIAQYSRNGKEKFVIDGFPRSDESAAVFEVKVAKPKAVLTLECPRETAPRRFLVRGREHGDDEAMFAKRYAEFQKNNQVIEDRYHELVKRVDTSRDGEEEESYKNLLEKLEELVPTQ